MVGDETEPDEGPLEDGVDTDGSDEEIDAAVESALEDEVDLEPRPRVERAHLRPARRQAQFEREIEQGLRQAPAKSTSSSWWLGKDREALSQEAEQRSVEMSASKLASKVSGARGIRMFSE